MSIILTIFRLVPLTFGICIPKICDPKFFKTILDQFGQTINILVGDYDQALNCNDGVDPNFTPADIAAMYKKIILANFMHYFLPF